MASTDPCVAQHRSFERADRGPGQHQKIRRVAAGFTNFAHYRTRILLAIGGCNWALIGASPPLNCEEPLFGWTGSTAPTFADRRNVNARSGHGFQRPMLVAMNPDQIAPTRKRLGIGDIATGVMLGIVGATVVLTALLIAYIRFKTGEFPSWLFKGA